MSLEIKNLDVHAGEFSLQGVCLKIETGCCGVLMGKSGAGKTTLMEGLCGLRKVDQGSILIGELEAAYLRPGERKIGLVPQDTVLFPHMTVREHLEFGPRLVGWSPHQISERVDELASELGLQELLGRPPQGLSGGEGKRVSLGRAIAAKPALLCLDEALTGLDEDTHEVILALLQSTIRKEKLTTLHITHRRDEAEKLADVLYFLEDGEVRQETLNP